VYDAKVACRALGVLQWRTSNEGERERESRKQTSSEKATGTKKARTGKSGKSGNPQKAADGSLLPADPGKRTAVGLAAATGDALLAGVTLGVRPAALVGATGYAYREMSDKSKKGKAGTGPASARNCSAGKRSRKGARIGES